MHITNNSNSRSEVPLGGEDAVNSTATRQLTHSSPEHLFTTALVMHSMPTPHTGISQQLPLPVSPTPLTNRDVQSITLQHPLPNINTNTIETSLDQALEPRDDDFIMRDSHSTTQDNFSTHMALDREQTSTTHSTSITNKRSHQQIDHFISTPQCDSSKSHKRRRMSKNDPVPKRINIEIGSISSSKKERFRAAIDAVRLGDVEWMRQLLLAGIDVNHSFERKGLMPGNNLLYLAVEREKIEIVRLLLAASADLEKRNENKNYKGRTVLFRVAESDRRNPLLKLLLEHGANCEATDSKGRTPLFCAIFFHLRDNVHCLLNYGANAQAVDNNGQTPLLSIIEESYCDISIVCEWLDIIWLLLQKTSAEQLSLSVKERRMQTIILENERWFGCDLLNDHTLQYAAPGTESNASSTSTLFESLIQVSENGVFDKKALTLQWIIQEHLFSVIVHGILLWLEELPKIMPIFATPPKAMSLQQRRVYFAAHLIQLKQTPIDFTVYNSLKYAKDALQNRAQQQIAQLEILGQQMLAQYFYAPFTELIAKLADSDYLDYSHGIKKTILKEHLIDKVGLPEITADAFVNTTASLFDQFVQKIELNINESLQTEQRNAFLSYWQQGFKNQWSALSNSPTQDNQYRHQFAQAMQTMPPFVDHLFQVIHDALNHIEFDI